MTKAKKTLKTRREAAVATRRSETRFELKFLVPYRLQDRTEELLTGHVRNLGVGGLLFEADRPLPVHTALHLFLDNLPGARESVRIEAGVVRTEIEEETGRYLIGVTFPALGQEARALVERALQTTDVYGLLRQTAERGGSDLHLSADHPPLARVSGNLEPLRDEPLEGLDVRDMVYTVLDHQHRASFERDRELDFSLSVSPSLRYRVNVHSQRGNVEAAFRRIEPAIRTFGELHLPDMLRAFADRRDGLVLITGPTGSGKTTAAAAMVDHINRTRTAVVITLESPIEYIHTYQRSVIKQREIGVDTFSYAVALREALRQDPDVILIGELSDEETIQTAMDAAQTGHLVVATISAADGVQAIHRVCQFFRKADPRQVLTELAASLRGIVSLRLLPRLDGRGMIPATEIIVNTTAVANLLRKGAIEQIASVVQAGGIVGMQSFPAALGRLVKAGTISPKAAQSALQGQETEPVRRLEIDPVQKPGPEPLRPREKVPGETQGVV